MTKEISEMTEIEAKEMIINISRTMYKEYDISFGSIQNFWNIVIMGIETLTEKQEPQIDELKSSSDVAYM